MSPAPESVETAHVIGLSLSVGLILLLDLRLVGAGFRRVTPAQILSQLKPWYLAGFTGMLLSGALLFWSEAFSCYQSPSFRWKIAFLCLAGLNAAVFEVVSAADGRLGLFISSVPLGAARRLILPRLLGGDCLADGPRRLLTRWASPISIYDDGALSSPRHLASRYDSPPGCSRRWSRASRTDLVLGPARGEPAYLRPGAAAAVDCDLISKRARGTPLALCSIDPASCCSSRKREAGGDRRSPSRWRSSPRRCSTRASACGVVRQDAP